VSGWLPALLAAAAVAVLVGTVRPGAIRLAGVRLHPQRASRPPALRRSVLVPVLAGSAGAAVAGPLAGALAAVAAVVAAGVLVRRRAAAGDRAERRRLLEALAVLAGDLRAGRSPAEGLAAATEVASGPSGARLVDAAVAARLGGDVPAALLGGPSAALLGGPSAAPDALRGLAACWQVCAATGSGLASGVERLEEGLRAAEAQRRAVDAELAGPRATAGLLAVLPVGGLALASALGAHPLHVLLHTPVGMVCLVAGVGLDGLGLLWAGRLVARAGAG
jgi:tight adherence protein B